LAPEASEINSSSKAPVLPGAQGFHDFFFFKVALLGRQAPLASKADVGQSCETSCLSSLQSLDVISNGLGLLVRKPRDAFVMWSFA
jgi:hypothetical protein